MSNSHAVPDSFYELQAVCGDLLPGVLRSHSGLTVPASSMTLAAVAVTGYVMGATELVYVAQPAVSIALAGGNGTYWLCLHRDLSTAVAGWTRRSGSHYLWQLAGSQPADPVGGLVFASVTVAAGVISAVTPLPTPTSAPMSKQLAGAVAITGGTAGLQRLGVGLAVPGSNGQAAINTLGISGAADPTYSLRVYYDTALGQNDAQVVNVYGRLGVGKTPPDADKKVQILFARASGVHGLTIQGNTDTGGGLHVLLTNAAGSVVGSIACTGSATSFNTTSDARLKHSITPLTDALATLLALRPVNFKWNADDSQDEGFLAHELQQHIPHAVTGEPDQVHEDGSIKPQQVDHSKLVVWLTGAVQTLAARVQALEEALGV